MKATAIAWRVALTVLLAATAWRVWKLHDTYVQTQVWAARIAADEAEKTRAAALTAITDTRKDLLGEVANLRKDVMVRVDDGLDKAYGNIVEIRTDVNASLKDATGKLDAQLTRANDSLAVVTGGAKPVLDHAASITAHADEASAILFRRDALPAQLLGLTAAAKVTLGETAQTMRDVRGAVPGFLASGKQIAGNVQLATQRFSSVADNVNNLTKPRWYDRLLGYGLNGVVIYRNLNPATNLTVKGAQFITSQK
jgi:hypothetical protein